MRIDNGTKAPGIGATGAQETTRAAGAASKAKAGSASRAGGDALELSGLGEAVRSLALRIMADDAAMRAIRVNELRQAVADGTLQPDPEKTAQAMLDHAVDA